jgi:hypothetical protein
MFFVARQRCRFHTAAGDDPTARCGKPIHGDDLKLMVNYIHTWSDFREANPEFGDDADFSYLMMAFSY